MKLSPFAIGLMCVSMALSIGACSSNNPPTSNNPPANDNPPISTTPPANDTPPASGNKWTAKQKEPFLKACVKSATSSSSGAINQTQAISYCNCTLEALESRYSYQDIEQKGVSVVQELQEDGTVKSCLQKAGVAVP